MAISRLRAEDVSTMNSIRHYKGIFQIVSANTAIHSYFTSATAVSCLGYQSPNIRCLSTRRWMSTMMPGITVEHILNSPFIEIDVEEEGDEDE